ncbi:hypothetical protein FRX31_028190 [Thalictrum thalictroides]|uniref:FBD domain-containing protein n=1 Tax=Thalictrum thalictroides TaxID=46969 RepID=A0A7J6VDD6_THATH|nr:hypothetical protein FRX31_028190 [Thalictrum thalictroides]
MEQYLHSNKFSSGDNLKHLRSVEIEDFGGSESQQDIVRHLLESASILEKMDIRYSNDINHNAEKLTKIDEKLLLFHEVSSNAEIVLLPKYVKKVSDIFVIN